MKEELKEGHVKEERKKLWRAESLKEVEKRSQQWENTTLKRSLKKIPESEKRFETLSQLPVKRLYTPLDVADLDYNHDLGFPGEFPYTRGVYATMYRGQLWTQRQISGFGTAEDTNNRIKFLLKTGQTGISVDFDMATILGWDSDGPMSAGEVGKTGVAIDSLRDMETLFRDIPLDKISTSMTINFPAPILYSMYLVMAEKRGIPWRDLAGTIQFDLLKEYISQNLYIFPPRPSMRLVTDLFQSALENTPRWNVISISGYHIREAGSTAVQELAFTLAAGMTYVEHALEAGLNIDDFAPRLSFFFNCHNDFFEEIAKMRAARRLWARLMRYKYGAEKPESWRLRFHTQTAGVSLTAQQPVNNIIRVAIQALAAVLGGTQSLHCNGMDEAFCVPSEEAMHIALRTQQIIAHETGVTNTVDPLGGSYYLEYLTNRMEEEAKRYFEEIEARGGFIACIENGYLLREIANASYVFQREQEEGKRITVGVNQFIEEGEKLPMEIFKVDPRVEARQRERLRRLREERDNALVEQRLQSIRDAARGDANLMPFILDAVRAEATEGEIIQALKDIFGEYVQTPIS